ncbi:hypothetical protein ElyMa_002694100 [Elysia marginata]|uniref:Uncharacterized protein n=1 Tax=Elysia marginata TaxID=1093978 RepID=A0AAV4HEF2_9GAST|nr:hypothetical protein ElyMa_002694100 [Elysia marginata]
MLTPNVHSAKIVAETLSTCGSGSPSRPSSQCRACRTHGHDAECLSAIPPTGEGVSGFRDLFFLAWPGTSGFAHSPLIKTPRAHHRHIDRDRREATTRRLSLPFLSSHLGTVMSQFNSAASVVVVTVVLVVVVVVV